MKWIDAYVKETQAELTALRQVAEAAKWVRGNHNMPCRCHLCAALAELENLRRRDEAVDI